MEKNKISKAKLCVDTGIARTTLDAILNGSDAKISTIENIAKVLGVKIGYLFDEEQRAGISQTTFGDFSPAAGNGDISISMGADPELAAENADLRRRLLAAQEKIIKLMERE